MRLSILTHLAFALFLAVSTAMPSVHWSLRQDSETKPSPSPMQSEIPTTMPSPSPVQTEDPILTASPSPVQSGDPMLTTPSPSPSKTKETIPTTAEPTPSPSPSNSTETTTEPEPEPTPDSDDVCVDEQYLLQTGHTRDQFVHKVARLVNAYCPPSNLALPCGSEHHKLRLSDGTSVSYRDYCRENACERRVLKVNSVFSHLWEETVHGDVRLTMFDVRHPESAQKLLHWTMHKVRNL